MNSVFDLRSTCQLKCWALLLLQHRRVLLSLAYGYLMNFYHCFKLVQVPTASITVEGNPALNRVRWTHSGREIAVGDSEGQIVIYDVGEVCMLCIVQSILQTFGFLYLAACLSFFSPVIKGRIINLYF